MRINLRTSCYVHRLPWTVMGLNVHPPRREANLPYPNAASLAAHVADMLATFHIDMTNSPNLADRAPTWQCCWHVIWSSCPFALFNVGKCQQIHSYAKVLHYNYLPTMTKKMAPHHITCNNIAPRMHAALTTKNNILKHHE